VAARMSAAAAMSRIEVAAYPFCPNRRPAVRSMLARVLVAFLRCVFFGMSPFPSAC
jgi:hypothetical protein